MAAAADLRGKPPTTPLLGLSSPILKPCGNRRVTSSAGADCQGDATGDAAADRRLKALPRSGGDEDGGLEELRAKLMGHLREAADRMELVPAPEPEPEADRPWSMRTRSGGIGRKKPNPSLAAAPTAEEEPRRTGRRRSDGEEKSERVKFSISLSAEEIEEDIYAVTGSRPRRRPKKRPKIVQRELDSLFPGTWLSEITADSYKVQDE
ncbi:uncharacterized protein [Typha angustifolia]|uniref:uncharacterized protein n=1 Tax=Typha angustifolia TaxID=59011 RepID=UPI003C2F0535